MGTEDQISQMWKDHVRLSDTLSAGGPREYHRKRQLFREKLFGTSDVLAWQVPPPLDDLDATLAQHAAQINNAVRYTMELALSDDITPNEHALTVGSLARMIQTNIAIAKLLGPRAKSKTVRGGAMAEDAQD